MTYTSNRDVYRTIVFVMKSGIILKGYNKTFMNKHHYKNNTLQAVGGLLLTGTGLSISVDAGSVRAKGGKWFWYGTVALVIFQAGLCLVTASARKKNSK